MTSEHAIVKFYSNQCPISRKYIIECRCGWSATTQTKPDARRRMKDHKLLAQQSAGGK